MKKRGFTFILAFLFILNSISSAQAVVYTWWVQASEDNFHWGCSGSVYVNTSPRVDLQKVVSIWTTRTDEKGWCEIGHVWDTVHPVYWFYAWADSDYWYESGYSSSRKVSPGSYISYKVYYNGNDNYHYFYVGSTYVTKTRLDNMTSCWPATNAEKEFDNDPAADNAACFKNLKYKSSSTGSSWYDWNGNQVWYDNDPYYYNKFYLDKTHIDVVHS